LVYSNKRKLRDILGNPKDKFGVLEESGVYQVECTGCECCDAVYICQTKRFLKEHYSSIRLNHPEKSNIVRHVLQKIKDSQDHTISLDQLTLIKESFYISRRKKEDANLMNVAAGRITSRLFDLVP
jgi:hypothetical protein